MPIKSFLIGNESTAEESFFRSAPMNLVQIYIPVEAVQAVVAELGELGIIQFSDLNSNVNAFQRTFTNEIRKLDELDRKLCVLVEHSDMEGVEVRSWRSLISAQESLVSIKGKALYELDDLEPQISELGQRVLQLHGNQIDLQDRFFQLLEFHAVLCALSPFLDLQSNESLRSSVSKFSLDCAESSSAEARMDDSGTETLELGGPKGAQEFAESNFIAGAIPKKKFIAFERVLWRALRGNVLVRNADMLMEPPGALSSIVDDLSEPKTAFVAFAHGKETLSRLRKICQALGCSLHDVDPSSEKRREKLVELTGKLDDLYAVLFNTRQAKRAVLKNVSDCLERWLILVRKKKAILDIMNCFNCDSDMATRKYFLAEGWCTSKSLTLLDASIKAASDRVGINVAPVLTVLDPGSRVPPTHFPINKFTRVYQDITDSYGVGSYQEINPTIFMIISFPFLFAVMFGDAGHALLMTIFATWMILNEKNLMSQKQSDIFEMIFAGRYVLILMGVFSIFTGLIYNDAFSRAMALFPSSFDIGGAAVVRPNANYVYPFGIDPVWSLSSNVMVFMNSYKMKQSVILGICQMMFGIVISALNHRFFGNYIDIFCTFLPQCIFMLSIFGYLCIMIVYKWIAGWDSSILTLFITMILKFGAVEGVPIYPGQELVQIILLIVAFICVPWMLFSKPIVLILERKRLRTQGYEHAIGASDGSGSSHGTESISSTTKKAANGDHEHGMGEIWVHQVIHTIEFVLGSVSNTASYLRLWALSLAHAELSEVLWVMAIEKFVLNPIILFFSFWIWLGFTIAILVGMEGMSAFLHALRLHWVEFNNKFYVGDGVKFEPFSLQDDAMFYQSNPNESSAKSPQKRGD